MQSIRVALGAMALMGSLSSLAFADNACGNDGVSNLMKVTEWSITPIEADRNYMTETLVYTGTKPIRMIDGSISYSDVLGKHIASKAIHRDVSIEPGGVYVQKGNWGLATFERLLKMNRSDVMVVACIRGVVYADGTKETFPAK